MIDNVILLRSQTTVEHHPFFGVTVVRVQPDVSLAKLIRGLALAGLTLRHDQRAGEFAILPILLARQEEVGGD